MRVVASKTHLATHSQVLGKRTFQAHVFDLAEQPRTVHICRHHHRSRVAADRCAMEYVASIRFSGHRTNAPTATPESR